MHLENLALRRQLDSLLHEARDNEDKLRRFDQLERCIIGAASFLALVELLLTDYRRVFAVQHVSLALIDPTCEIPLLLAAAGESLPSGLLLLDDDAMLQGCFKEALCAQLSPFDVRRHAALFPDSSMEPASVAVLPLYRQDVLIGSINLGSADIARYGRHVGTEFLDRLSAVAAVCIESALSRERLKRAGMTDALTGVHNRRYFDHRCPAETHQARRQQQPLACMFLDIDRFKRINDTYGHPAGDRVLHAVAVTIKAQLRSSDILARYGGEEFVVLLPQTAHSHAFDIAERIRVSLAEKTILTATREVVPVTVSIGLSMCPLGAVCAGEDDAATSMVAAADRALYAAKSGGRNRVVGSATIDGQQVARGGCLPRHNVLARWAGRLVQLAKRVKRLPMPVPSRT